MPELIIVDDVELILRATGRHAEANGIDHIAFSSGVKALKFLQSCDGLPLSYLIDMKLADPLSGSPELAAPLEIYRYLKSRDANLDGFYYMTGGMSEHDIHVQEITGADVLLKPVSMEELAKIFHYIRSERPTEHPGPVQELKIS